MRNRFGESNQIVQWINKTNYSYHSLSFNKTKILMSAFFKDIFVQNFKVQFQNFKVDFMKYVMTAIQTHCNTFNVDSTLEIWTPTPRLLTSTSGTKKLAVANALVPVLAYMNVKVPADLKLRLRRHTGTLIFTSIHLLYLMIHFYVEN